MKLTTSSVKAAKPQEREYFIWDEDLRGFGLRVWPSGRKVFIVQVRVGGGREARSRRITLGEAFKRLTPDEARKEAKQLILRATIGDDPRESKRLEAAARMTVNDLLDDWRKRGAHLRKDGSRRKPASVEGDIRRFDAHIRPLIGTKPLASISRREILQLRADIAVGKTASRKITKPRGVANVRGGDGTAVRTLRALSGVFRFAVEEGLLDESPFNGVRLPAPGTRERYLSGEELARLGEALEAANSEGLNPHGINIIRLLALTGARRGEIESLRWSDIDFDRGALMLPDTKTGRAAFPLSGPALAILGALGRQEGVDWVFPATRGKGHYKGVQKVWVAVREKAGLEGVRLHDLRHSFASIGAVSGLGLQTVGKLLGHRNPATTARYSHIADDPLRAAADQIGGVIAARMGLAKPKVVEQ